MTANRKPDEADLSMPDVFDMERQAREVPPPGALDSQGGDTRPAPSWFAKILKSAKPRHFLIVGAAATLFWIAMPYLFSNAPDVTKPESRLMLPIAAPAMPIPPQAVPRPRPERSESVQQQPAAEDIPTAPAQQLPQTAPQETPFVQPAPAAQAVPWARAKTQRHRAPSIIEHHRSTSETIGSASLRFSINTVYAGQAWIQDDERTYVVQAGDKVDGIEIINIDARGRRVFTSRGVIR